MGDQQGRYLYIARDRLSLLRLVVFMTVLGSATTSILAANGLVTEILPIGYRPPQQLLSILKPLVPAPGNVAATHDHLVVTTTRDNLRQIKDILATLDRPPKSLLVSIHYEESNTAERTTGKISAKIGGSELELSSGDPGAYVRHGDTSRMQTQTHDQGVAAQIWRTESASDSRREQQLRVIDGAPACISRGRLAPFGTQKTLFIHGALLGVEATTQYVDLSTGFCVVPRVRGAQVLLDIAPQSAYEGLGNNGIIETKNIHTTVSVPLGRWVEIGSIGQKHEGTGGLHLSTRTTEAIFIKVDEVSP